MEIKELVGKRILVQDNSGLKPLHEVKILEVSPSGESVKVAYEGGSKWDFVADFYQRYKVLEVLGDKPKLSARRHTNGKIL